MCIGVPMQIIQINEGLADCVSESENLREWVDMSLIGEQPVGTWILVFMGAGREVIEDDRVPLLINARMAMVAALQNGNVDMYFADLINREPELPEFLRGKTNA